MSWENKARKQHDASTLGNKQLLALGTKNGLVAAPFKAFDFNG